ncbi:MAG TPA: hypothetical protein PLL30_15505 [Candidatus Krumholzibacteria bacterium]|nr:hypothetical protein [Candidatus Krumholzibacteria bacterium]HPD73177.1 hypothetical protein [Candidatus Krumholzibacteria bacterium]HRY41945.1 hypothetical protein [Candidatus Krumholzibacteria bacterium]
MPKRFLGPALAAFALILPVAAGAAAATTATTWDEALALSRQQDKPILIDFFTEW